MSGEPSPANLAKRLLALEPSPMAALTQKAAALRAAGHSIIDLTSEEPDLPTPAPVVEAAVSALQEGRTRYAPDGGLPELRAAIVARYRKDFGVDFAEDEVVVTSGGRHSLALACQALLERGGEVIVPSPHWPPFPAAVRLVGARPIVVHAQESDGFQVTARLISKATSPKTQAVLLSSACNPTGAVMDAEDLLVIGDMAQRRRFTILLDDSYARLLFRPEAAGTLQTLREAVSDRFVILGSASRTYAMTGWRLGWLLGPRTLVSACAALCAASTLGPATFVQAAAVTALSGAQRSVQTMVAEYRRRRDACLSTLRAIPRVTCVEPGGGLFLFPNVARHLSAELPSTLAMADALLDEGGVAVVPGETYAAPGYLRLSLAAPRAHLKEGLERLARFLKERSGP